MIFLRLFKDSRLKGTLTLILLLIAIFIPSIISDFSSNGPSELVAHTGMPFYMLIFGAMHTVPVLNHLLAMLLIMLISYMLIHIGVRDQLLHQRSLMPAIFFILFTVALPAAREVSPALIGSVFYLLCFIILFEVHDKRPDTLSIFSASLLLVLGSMFYLKLIWFIPLIWISLWTLRQVTWRELLYPVAAYALLALFLFTWFWGIRDNGADFIALITENLSFDDGFQSYHFSVYILYAYVLLLVSIASIYIAQGFQSMKTSVQTIFQVMFYMFVAGFAFFVFITRFDPTSLVFIAFPVTFVLSNYLHRKKSPWIHELALWILVGLVVYVQIVL